MISNTGVYRLDTNNGDLEVYFKAELFTTQNSIAVDNTAYIFTST